MYNFCVPKFKIELKIIIVVYGIFTAEWSRHRVFAHQVNDLDILQVDAVDIPTFK